MLAKARFYFDFTCAFLAACSFFSHTGCRIRHDIPSEYKSAFPSKPFVVAVVGDGVPSAEPANRDHPLNNAQGRAMWAGANAAFNRSPECEHLRSFAELEPHDDG